MESNSIYVSYFASYTFVSSCASLPLENVESLHVNTVTSTSDANTLDVDCWKHALPVSFGIHQMVSSFVPPDTCSIACDGNDGGAALLISLIRHRLTCCDLFILCDSATITYMLAGAVTNNENRSRKPYHSTIRVAYSILCLYWTQNFQGVPAMARRLLSLRKCDGRNIQIVRANAREKDSFRSTVLSVFKYCFTPWALRMTPYILLTKPRHYPMRTFLCAGLLEWNRRISRSVTPSDVYAYTCSGKNHLKFTNVWRPIKLCRAARSIDYAVNRPRRNLITCRQFQPWTSPEARTMFIWANSALSIAALFVHTFRGADSCDT